MNSVSLSSDVSLSPALLPPPPACLATAAVIADTAVTAVVDVDMSVACWGEKSSRFAGDTFESREGPEGGTPLRGRRRPPGEGPCRRCPVLRGRPPPLLRGRPPEACGGGCQLGSAYP